MDGGMLSYRLVFLVRFLRIRLSAVVPFGFLVRVASCGAGVFGELALGEEGMAFLSLVTDCLAIVVSGSL